MPELRIPHPGARLPLLRIAGFAILLLFVFYPLLSLIQESLTVDGRLSAGNFSRFFSPEQTRSLYALWGSIWISLVSVIGAGVIGVPMGILFERVALPGHRFLATVATLPIVLPPLVGVVAFLFLLGESGMLPRVLQAAFGLDSVPFYLEGVGAVIAVHAYSFYVYFFLFVRAAMKRLDGSLIEAAQNLGASPWRLYRQVILPHLRPAISGAAIIVFMISMASFTAPLIFAGDYRFLTVEIYNNKLQGDMGLAVTQSVMLGLISIAFLYLNLRTGGVSGAGGQKGVPLPPRTIATPWVRGVASSIAVAASLTLALPHLTLLLLSFARDGSWTTQIFPQVYTFENYARIFTSTKAAGPVVNSARMAITATVANVFFALAFAYWNSRRPNLAGKISEAIIMLPWAIPGTVVAIALIVTFNQPHWFTGGAVLVGTFWLLPLAYFIRHLPIVYRASHAAFSQFDPRQEEAANSLGAGSWLTFRKVVLPAVWPGVLAGGLLAMVMSLGEFVSSILIYTFSNRPISVAILSEVRLFNLGTAAAYGILLTILIFTVTFFTSRWSDQQ